MSLAAARRRVSSARAAELAVARELRRRAQAAGQALARHTVEEAEETLADAWRRLDARRAARAPRGRHGRIARCGGCNAFVSNPEITCGACGFTPGYGWPR